jgi:hypothetical protein
VVRRFLSLFLLLSCAAFARDPGTPSATTPSPDWRAIAKIDLDAVHRLIVEAHPGMIDEQNPSFRNWAEAGYHEALALLPEVTTYNSTLAVVRYFTSGFLDGHLVFSDNARRSGTIVTNGWMLNWVNDQYIVAADAEGWSAELPPIGAILRDCDGRTPRQIIDLDVTPFDDRRGFPPSQRFAAASLAYEMFESRHLHNCRFQTPDGRELLVPVEYHEVPFGTMIAMYAAIPRPRSWSNSYDLKDGVLWIHAGNFNLRPDDLTSLNTMLEELRKLKGVKVIVFDSRGNGGGDSSIGGRIFEAATGGLRYDRRGIDQLPRTYAQWRVSPQSISTIEERVQHFESLYGAKSHRTQEARQFLEQLKDAQKEGKPWVEQDDGHLMTRAEMTRRHGHLRRFKGSVVLVTDDTCASACLDFADLVRSVPGSIHVGQTTSADAVYIDVGAFPVPSGNRLILPLKVWRSRERGNNEPLHPDIPLTVNLNDDDAVRAATTAILPRHLH